MMIKIGKGKKVVKKEVINNEIITKIEIITNIRRIIITKEDTSHIREAIRVLINLISKSRSSFSGKK